MSAGTKRILVAGGDGSIHEVVNGILRSGETVELGVIPTGTGNDFAKACYIPVYWEDAVPLLADRIRAGTPPHPVDAGRLVAVFQGMIDGVSTPHVTMKFSDQIVEGPLTLASVSNGAWVGGMFHLAPMARNDDGALDLVYVEPVSRLRIMALLPKLMRGTHIDQPEITHSQVTQCQLTAAAPVPSHLDGEVQPLQTHFEIELLQGALRLL